MTPEDQVSGQSRAARLGAAAPRATAPRDVKHAPRGSSDTPSNSTPARVGAHAHAPAQTNTQAARTRHPNKSRRAGHEPLTHEGRVLLMTLAAGAPAVLVSLVLLWVGDYTPKVFWTLGVLIADPQEHQ